MIRKLALIIRNPSIIIWFLNDFLDKHCRPMIALMLVTLAGVFYCFGRRRRSFMLVMSAHRVSNGRLMLAERLLLKNRSATINAAKDYIETKKYSEKEVALALGRVITLKEPVKENSVVVEKGAILIKFTDSFGVLYQKFDFSRISEDFYIILEPSWAGYCLPEILIWADLPNPIIIQATDFQDLKFLRLIGENIYGASVGSSNWVDESCFYPISGMQKSYDALYVTNYNRIKRHHVFFKAISIASSRNPEFRAAMACGAAGTDRIVIFKLIEFYGIKNVLDVYENIDKPTLNKLINRSYCNILLSLKEGSNRSLFESMFAGVPAILHAENVGVRKSYINPVTGILADDKSLVSAISWVKNHSDAFDPLSWAKENIAPEVTTEYLVSIIRGIEGNQQWGRASKMFVKVNRPEATYKWAGPDSELFNAIRILNSYL